MRTYRLVYRTASATGQPTTASGLLAVPVNTAHRLSVVSFTHGTEVYRGDAPSMQPHGFEPASAYTYSSAGFATVEPDYLGLGTGPGPHPWMDVPSETTAALDMLHAARTYLAGHGRTLRADDLVILARARADDQILVSGDHDFVQMLFASGDTRPSLVLVREVEALPSAELAALLLAALSAGLADLLPTGAIATLTPDRVRVRPLPLRPGVNS